MNPDVVVIGGGIAGCACAYYLAKSGLKVHLVEKGSIGGGASKAGMTHVLTWEEPAVRIHLARESKALYEELSAELPIDIQYRRSGAMLMHETEKSLAGFRESLPRLQSLGVKCQLVGQPELRELEPRIAPDLAGGVFFEDDAQVNPLHTVQALALAAATMGAVIEPHNAVTGLALSPSKTRIEAVLTEKGRLAAGAVVLAAGAWSAQVGKMAGLDIPIRPCKGCMVVTVPMPDDFFHNKILMAASYAEAVQAPGAQDVFVTANLNQTKNGNLLLGTLRQFSGFDDTVDPRIVARQMKRNLRYFPSLGEVTAIRIWTGLRPSCSDATPIISQVNAVGGLYIASGHDGLGITEAPITGKLISQMVTGQPLALPVEQLSFNRFA